jgi:hypothetical protein
MRYYIDSALGASTVASRPREAATRSPEPATVPPEPATVPGKVPASAAPRSERHAGGGFPMMSRPYRCRPRFTVSVQTVAR